MSLNIKQLLAQLKTYKNNLNNRAHLQANIAQDNRVALLNQLNRIPRGLFKPRAGQCYHAAKSLERVLNNTYIFSTLDLHLPALMHGDKELANIFAAFKAGTPIEGTARCCESEAHRWLRLHGRKKLETYTPPTSQQNLASRY